MPVRTISVLGGITQDLTTISDRLPDNGETVIARMFTMQAGGKGANSAVATFRLTRPNPENQPNPSKEISDDDIRVRMVGAVGKDEFGPRFHFYKERNQRWNTRAVKRNQGGGRIWESSVECSIRSIRCFKQLLYHISTFRLFSTGGVFSLNCMSWYMTENKRLLLFRDCESISEGLVLYMCQSEGKVGIELVLNHVITLIR